MEFLSLLLAMILPVAGGVFFIRWLLRGDADMGMLEAIFFGIGIGLGFTASEMFVLGLLGVPFTLTTAGLPILVFTILFFILFLVKKETSVAPGAVAPGLRGWRLYITIILASWIALKTGFVFYESLTRPIFSVDSYLNWAISGKIFFYRGGLILNPSEEHFFGRGYRFFIGHPLHLPLLQTWIALVLGKFHEAYIKAPGALYFAGLLGVLYYGVKREAGAFYAIITVFFMASVPILTAHGQDAYSDLPLSFFALSGTVAFWRFLKKDDLAYLALSGIFFGLAMFVKNEGLFTPLAAGFALVVFLFSRKKAVAAPLLAFIIPIILLAGPWLLFKKYYGIGFGHSGPSAGFKWLSDPFYTGSTGYGVHWEVLSLGFKDIFFTANYNLIFPLLVFVTILARRVIMRTELKYLYMIILLVFSMFLFIYLTLEVTAVTQGTGIHRNILTYLPIVYFTTALVLSAIRPDACSGSSSLKPPPASRGL